MVSPAEMPINSTPWYDPITIDKAKKNPMNPFGINPPCDHKLEIPIGFPPLPIPNKINPNPAIIINTIVTTLIKANQNSNSPNAFTETRLAAIKKRTAITPGIQLGRLGNQ